MYRIKRRALPDVRDAPLQDDNAAASCSDGKPRWRSWDGDYACYGISTSSLMNRTMDTLCFLQEFYIRVRWAASDVSPSSHLAFHIPNTWRVLFVLCFGFGVFVALLCFCFLFCKCFGIPNSPRSLDLDDRQGLIGSWAMQQVGPPVVDCMPHSWPISFNIGRMQISPLLQQDFTNFANSHVLGTCGFTWSLIGTCCGTNCTLSGLESTHMMRLMIASL